MSDPRPPRRRTKRWLVALLALTGAIILLLATPVPLWRTGRVEAPPLDLVSGGPPLPRSSRLWIDTDAACGATPRTDPDDCLAIAWLAATGHDIAGISTSYGNAGGDVVERTANMLAARIAGNGLKPIPVWRGWAGPVPAEAGTAPTAQVMLRAALEQGPLTILALGPLTNVAAVLDGRPDLQRNLTRLVAVMGHRPGHLFHPTEASGRGVLMGHGPIFRDLNFGMDEASARSILRMRLPLTLIPYDAARHAPITAGDLETLVRQAPALAWAAGTAKGWLAFWQEDIGQPGFYPFDWVAAAYVAEPRLFDCAQTNAWIATEWAFWLYPRRSLLVGPRLEDADGSASVLYCPQANPTLHDYLLTGKINQSQPGQ
ncbi:MAG: nucleoside hydrolase [Aestuariivirga sp.]